ncbi:hypothetical protein [Roseovarius sp.]|jgi:hypothetical protein|uniref:hypothetical protein n=2 Tax=Roseovarius sp. TaxID=1486281 RepID=UPI0032EE71CC
MTVSDMKRPLDLRHEILNAALDGAEWSDQCMEPLLDCLTETEERHPSAHSRNEMTRRTRS